MGLVPSAYVNSEYPLQVTPGESVDERFTKYVVIAMLGTCVFLSFLVRNCAWQRRYVFKNKEEKMMDPQDPEEEKMLSD